MPAKLTTDEFTKRGRLLHGTQRYDYSKAVYQSLTSRIIIICPVHGEFTQIAARHLAGDGCRLCFNERVRLSLQSDTPSFIRKAKAIHGNRYNYNAVMYKASGNNVLIGCDIHGIYQQTPNKHLSGQGCPKCGIGNASLARASSSLDFIERAKEIHRNKYCYNEVMYINRRSLVKIKCLQHGIFEQSPANHLSGNGCIECNGIRTAGYLYKRWIELQANRITRLYIIRCSGNNEVFYKVGITHKAISRRFSGNKTMPYSYTIEHCIESSNADLIWKLEKQIHDCLRPSKYKPAIAFVGYTECFSSVSELPANLLAENVSDAQL